MRRVKSIAVLVILICIMLTIFSYNSIYITPVGEMKPGSYGDEVRKLQQRLKNWGFYNGSIDGNYEWNTYLAVREYQEKSGIPVTGIAGYDTLLAMGFTRIKKASAVYAQSNNISNEQLLARAINGEARGEPYEGQVAVGAVILNRVRDAKFPKTIAGVIYQPGAFTAVSDGQINVPIDSKSTVVKAARDALNGWDPTNGCIYYWNPATATSKWIWSRTIVKKIGKHYFGK